MFLLVDVSYGSFELIGSAFTLDQAYDRAIELLENHDLRLQIIEHEIIRWDSRDGFNKA